MAFLLYRIDGAAGCFRKVTELSGRLSLWGENGAVARCASRQLSGSGAWRATEVELLGQLLPLVAGHQSADPVHFALLDDLVPRGPERLLGRIVDINGYLDGHYNPVLITFAEVLNAQPPEDPAGRASFARPGIDMVPLPLGQCNVIRTVNYLWRRWRPPRSFSGALLWPQHWEHFRALPDPPGIGKA
jgi:hypothetical protein